jgi:hypothetical protein
LTALLQSDLLAQTFGVNAEQGIHRTGAEYTRNQQDNADPADGGLEARKHITDQQDTNNDSDYAVNFSGIAAE